MKPGPRTDDPWNAHRFPGRGGPGGIKIHTQSGSRPGKKCQDVVIFKHMIYLVLRLTRFDGITFDNDAKFCFDRIVLAAASLIVQRLGMSKDVMELFIDTLSKVEYFAKTYY
jgi:hypothetical protein